MLNLSRGPSNVSNMEAIQTVLARSTTLAVLMLEIDIIGAQLVQPNECNVSATRPYPEYAPR
jgi:hypothetical protein